MPKPREGDPAGKFRKVAENLYHYSGSQTSFYARFRHKGERIVQRLGTSRSPCTSLAEAKRRLGMEDAFQRLLVDMGCGDMGISGARRGSKRGTDGPAFAVKLGSVNVLVYRTEGNGLLRFFVTFYRDGRRVRRSFTNPEDAKTEARLMARKIMAGHSQGTDLSAPEQEAYLAAKNLLDGMGCPLLAAAEEYAECKRLLGSRSLLAAVTEHVERTRGVQTEVTVPASAAEFLKAKKQDGASTRYLAQLRSDIGRFAADLPGAILVIRSHDIDQWLRRLGGAPRTRNTTHTSLRTFFAWAKSRSYLPRSEETAAAAVAKVRVGDIETEIFTPEQMAKILEVAPAELIPFIALGAFAGLRAAEITRIGWNAIDLERRFIMIRAGQAKTASRRIVPVSANLRAWLLPHVGEGMVVPSAETYRKVSQRVFAHPSRSSWPWEWSQPVTCAPSTSCLPLQYAAVQKILDVTQRGVGRALGQLGILRRGELAFEAVQRRLMIWRCRALTGESARCFQSLALRRTCPRWDSALSTARPKHPRYQTIQEVISISPR